MWIRVIRNGKLLLFLSTYLEMDKGTFPPSANLDNFESSILMTLYREKTLNENFGVFF